jgi:LPS-assembly protein
MPPISYRRKLSVLAILSLGSLDAMAQGLPALRVDPTLLGQPTPAAPTPAPTPAPARVADKVIAPDTTPAVTAVTAPVRRENEVKPTTRAEQSSAQNAPTKTLPAVAAPTSTPTNTPTARSSTSPAPAAPATPSSATASATATPTTNSAVVIPTLASSSLPPCRPTPTASAPGLGSARISSETVATQKLSPLRVDPALLGSAPVVPIAPTTPRVVDSAITCLDAPTGLAAAPKARRAGAVPLARLPQEIPRIPLGKPEETTIVADSISGSSDTEVIAQGQVELNKDDAVLEADRLVYRQSLDEVEATGNVRLSRNTEEMAGPYLKLHIKDKTGYFDQPTYVIQRRVLGGAKKTDKPALTDIWGLPAEPEKPPATGRGQASRLNFEGDGHYRLEDATFSTCTPNADGSLDWYTKVSDLKLDYDEGRGVGKHTTVYFQNTPILYTPYIDFPLDNTRKSGLLSPTIGTSTNGGFEFTQPYYWNIAPHMDATFAPRIMTKRGVQLQNEFRYLQPNYSGQLRAEVLPGDKEYDDDRWAYAFNHIHNFGAGFSGTLALNRASDGTYFKDMSNKLGISSQSLLLNQGVLNYGAGWWNASLTVQDYQVLQDPDDAIVAEPYARMPQLNINAVRADLPLGLQWNMAGEAVRFDHSKGGTEKILGTRTIVYPQISLPIQTSAFYLTPKVGYRTATYSLDKLDATWGSYKSASPSVGVPIASVDSGLVFERPSKLFGRSVTQTLEPRLYYLYVPDEDQSEIPLFDTGIADFNFAQIFSENRYAGGDRIGDANQLTGMVSSRFIDPDTGEELMRFGLGQRAYFTDQKVTLNSVYDNPALPNPEPNLRTRNSTDILGAFSGQILPRTYIDTAVQYSPDESRMERFNLGLRYQPEIGKVLNTAYRFYRGNELYNDGIKQVDVSAQWPIAGRWYGVGRYNYSLLDNRLIEGVAGLEYDDGCWIMRGVMQRTSTLSNDYNSSFFLQLELKDFSRIGSNPLNVLKRAVAGYREINAPENDPGFAAQ